MDEVAQLLAMAQAAKDAADANAAAIAAAAAACTPEAFTAAILANKTLCDQIAAGITA